MAKGRTPDKTPNKVMTTGAKSISNKEDGSRTISVSYNDASGNRMEGEITFAVENGLLVAKQPVGA